MTYVLLNETTQNIQHPPINKDNICNYNLDIQQLQDDGYVDISDSLIDIFNQGKGIVKNNSIADISDTQEYKDKQRLKQIDTEFAQATTNYNMAMDTPIAYPLTGRTYKPKYASESYMPIFQAEQLTKMADPTKTRFPVSIKDSTKLAQNARSMDATELLMLTAFLGNEATKLWDIKAKKENDLTVEKNKLIKG